MFMESVAGSPWCAHRSIAEIVSERWREIGTALQMTSVDFNAMKAVLENEDVARALRL